MPIISPYIRQHIDRMKKNARWTLLLPPLVIALIVLFQLLAEQPRTMLRNAVFDQYQRWQPRTYTETPVRIIDIDEASLARLGQWPWPRNSSGRVWSTA
jgi:adenylate cyclase